MRGLLCQVLRGKHLCANGGISERVDHVTLVGPGVPEVFTPTDDAPMVRLDLLRLGGTVYPRALYEGGGRPGQTMGPMASGAMITGDARFRDVTGEDAIKLLDRYETPAEYELLSR